ncbi:MAG: LysR family transcriptional regulator, partial [Pseudomonas aeruginosa]|nr:LysR family transcriptional regulator [Pseudomonas aeruginosa]
MDLNSLNTFIAIAETGSFSEAGERLHLTQPAVSKRIAALEQQLNARLFDRVGREVNLTEAGRALLPRAYQLLNVLDDTRRALNNLTGEVSGRLVLATSHHIGLHRLPPLLRAFTRAHPQVALDIQFLDSEVAYEEILHGRAELAVITLAPETNGQVAVKAWQALSEITGREHTHLALNKEDEKIRFRDIQAQPRKIISSPTWSGLEDEHVSYNAGYTNVHELIPWRTLSGRQSLYQDHQWMRDFGESLLVYRPPIDTRSVKAVMGEKSNGNPEKALNFLTPHQKWGIH